MLVQKLLGLLKMFWSECFNFSRSNDFLTKEMANHKVHLIAENCGSPRNNKQQNNIKTAIVGKKSRCK